MLELARYIVLRRATSCDVVFDPVRAGMCRVPEDWPWRSYRMMLGQVPAPPWLQRNWLLSQNHQEWHFTLL